MKKFKIIYSVDKTMTYETIVKAENRDDALDKIDTKSNTNSKLIKDCKIVSFDKIIELEEIDNETTV